MCFSYSSPTSTDLWPTLPPGKSNGSDTADVLHTPVCLSNLLSSQRTILYPPWILLSRSIVTSFLWTPLRRDARGIRPGLCRSGLGFSRGPIWGIWSGGIHREEEKDRMAFLEPTTSGSYPESLWTKKNRWCPNWLANFGRAQCRVL